MSGVEPGNGRRRERQRRQQLVADATDYVVEHGLSELSLRPLAAALGTSHKTLLYHFGSKEQLFAAILREARNRERLRAVARPVADGDAIPFVDLLSATWKYLSGPSEDAFWRFYFEIHALGLRDPERYDEGLRDGVYDWLAMIEAFLTAEGHEPEQATRLATLILGTFRGLQLDLLTTGDRERVDAAMQGLVDVVRAITPASRPVAERGA